jgi:hypothetical protein
MRYWRETPIWSLHEGRVLVRYMKRGGFSGREPHPGLPAYVVIVEGRTCLDHARDEAAMGVIGAIQVEEGWSWTYLDAERLDEESAARTVRIARGEPMPPRNPGSGG